MTWLNRILLALFITAAIAFLPSYEHMGSEDLDRVRAERDALREGNEALAREIDLLQAEVEALHVDPDDPGSKDRVDRELARIAREDLNMIMPGELVFEVHRPNSQSSENGRQ
ncbi:MAG: septum formation initiator family protein [Myxococcales bacterium]|nr:septum formation initiator family protein [Myxococcales bacterium]MCA9697504.1 septum formation initiator family protein [Myxococcales bacterium]